MEVGWHNHGGRDPLEIKSGQSGHLGLLHTYTCGYVPGTYTMSKFLLIPIPSKSEGNPGPHQKWELCLYYGNPEFSEIREQVLNRRMGTGEVTYPPDQPPFRMASQRPDTNPGCFVTMEEWERVSVGDFGYGYVFVLCFGEQYLDVCTPSSLSCCSPHTHSRPGLLRPLIMPATIVVALCSKATFPGDLRQRGLSYV